MEEVLINIGGVSMKAVKHPGKCKLCGEFKELTFEHVPPRKAFNSHAVMVFPFEEVMKTFTGEDGRMPWELSGLQGKIQQKGSGDYYLCRQCNNDTGSWYIEEYNNLAAGLHYCINVENFAVGNKYSVTIKNIYPLRVFKAMLTMLCDINFNCMGDPDLREFLLSKGNNSFDSNKYSLCLYLVSPQMSRINGITCSANIHNNTHILSTEINSYPIGFVLYIDSEDSASKFGVNVTSWAQYGYDEQCDITLIDVPFIEINSQTPLDYRTKEELISCIEENKKFENEYNAGR